MIEINNVVKKFDRYSAVNKLNFKIEDGTICGLVGTNGSGKSTLLRSISGVYNIEGGNIKVDGEDIFENTQKKSEIFYVSDDMYFPPNLNLMQIGKFYKSMYQDFDEDKFNNLLEKFPLDAKKKTRTYSKGMYRQAALIIAVSCNPKYLLLDEAFDGLDPVIRVAVRKIIVEEVAERKMTAVIASHNLRELEDLCDTVYIMHKGKLATSLKSDEIGEHFCKVQAAFKPMPEKEKLMLEDVLSVNIHGSVATIVAKCSTEKLMNEINILNPIFTEYMALSLEEVFVYEMEAIGYDYNKIIF